MSQTAKKAPNPEIEIRPASPGDAPEIQSLAQRIWPVCFKGIIEPHMIANMLERIYGIESLHEQMSEGQQFWIAYFGRQSVGYVSAYTQEDWIWLKKLYCDPAFQGKGIGKAMYETAVSAFPQMREVRLLVNNGNVTAQKWYERNGFTRVGELPVMMGDFQFTDYIYSKPLKKP